MRDASHTRNAVTPITPRVGARLVGMPEIASAERADTQPALDFRLSGAEVRATPTSLTVRRIARVRATDSPEVTASLSDASSAARLTEPGLHLPGRIEFGGTLPPARVTPSTLAAATALLAVLRAGGEGGTEAAADALATLADSGTPGVTGAVDSDAPSRRPSTLPTLPPEPDFYAFDVETANADEGSIIQFGIAAVRDGAVTETWSWPCRPPAGLEQFDEGNIAIHGIQPSDIADAPPFAERLGDFARLIDGTPLVAHNAKFDFTALQRACRAAGIDVPDIAFACTFRWAKRIGLAVENYRLTTLAAEAGVEPFDHHDAAADAAACAEVALWLMRTHPGPEATWDPVAYSASLGMDMGMLFGTTLVQMRTVGDSAVDGGGAPSRRQATRAKWDAAKTPDVIPERNADADPDGLLFGQTVTLTGDFAPYDKGRLWELIADAGATVGKNTTKKTTILVAGPWDSMTSKEKKAREYIDKGQEIQIWNEKQLYAVLGLEDEPPF